MNSYFRRQLADYVEYHRDRWNCAMHVFGIVFLFMAAVLPLSFWSVHAFGAQTTAAAMIVNSASVAGVWSVVDLLTVTGVTLQVVGHRVFERRQPALLDNPTHLLLGPMFVMAKLFIALGFRHDLALVIQPVSPPAPFGSSFYIEERQGKSHPHP